MFSSDEEWQPVPEDWRHFGENDPSVVFNGPYCTPGIPWSAEWRKLQRDVALGVPLALEIHAAFIAWKMKR